MSEANGNGNWWKAAMVTLGIFILGLLVQALMDRNSAWTQIHANTQSILYHAEELGALKQWKDNMIGEHADLKRRVQQMEESKR